MNNSNSKNILFSHHWGLWITLGLLFTFGLGIRLYDLTDLPLDFHPTRQLGSAVIARGMYYQDLDPKGFLNDEIHENYPIDDYHRVYYGEILAAFVDE